ncbi:MAG: glycosyltransferase, partial [Clostridiales bacterium]|nr:glycosyltransferase [Clostridiales bacterium]
KNQKKEIEKYIIDNHLVEDIKYLGYIPQEDMPYIFANAKALVFPSVFEGFGIPLVEAMKAGVAIACSDCGSIPEVAEDAALYFNAYDPKDIADKIQTLLQDDALREELIERGTKVAQKYSWTKCAVDTREYLYKIFTLAQCKENKINIYENEYPLVSVVTPSYNQGKFIETTIKSVLAQDYPNLEYIVMDGGSSDETISILQKYSDKIRWYSEKDRGQADAVNKGIRLAKGKIIGWLNSDDTYLEGAVSEMVDYLKTHPDTDMVYGEGYYTDKDGNITERYLTEKYNRKRLAEMCIICQPTAFFTKEIVERVGMLDVEHQLSMDYELWMRIAKVGKIAYIPDYIATSRMYEENKTLSRRKEVYEETCKAVKKHYGYVPINWIDGYADYIAEGTRGWKFHWEDIRLFVRFNFSNPGYCWNGMKSMLRSRCGGILRLHTAKQFTEQYPDKWLSKVYIHKIKVDDKKKVIIISGIHNWPLKYKLKISVLLDNKIIHKFTVEELGEFTKEIHIPQNEQYVSERELKLVMNKTFCPARIAKSEDQRELSFILDDIVLEAND